jgi:hypothetical protein
MTPLVTIAIPAHARLEPLRETLRSVAGSSIPFPWEVVVVDDGSPEPLAPILEREFPGLPLRVVRQANTGLIGARNRGLAEASGRYVLFLDSDDLVHPEKIRTQAEALEASGADVSYSDPARLPTGRPLAEAVPESPYPNESDVATPAHLYLIVQPVPHSPMFRRDYLNRHLRQPIVAADGIFNPIGEVWMYYNLAPHPARYVRTPGCYAVIGDHPGPRLTNHWERQGIAAATLMQCFLARCPELPYSALARQLVGRIAFRGWRALPPGFPREIADVRLAIWRSTTAPRECEGGRGYRLASAVLGQVATARLLKRLRQKPYAQIATMPLETVWEFHHRAAGVVAAQSIPAPGTA